MIIHDNNNKNTVGSVVLMRSSPIVAACRLTAWRARAACRAAVVARRVVASVQSGRPARTCLLRRSDTTSVSDQCPSISSHVLIIATECGQRWCTRIETTITTITRSAVPPWPRIRRPPRCMTVLPRSAGRTITSATSGGVRPPRP